MILDPNASRPGLDIIRPVLKQLLDSGIPLNDAVNRMAIVFGGNLTAFYLYLMRDDFLGPREDFQKTVDSLTKFYNYTKILPWADLEKK